LFTALRVIDGDTLVFFGDT